MSRQRCSQLAATLLLHVNLLLVLVCGGVAVTAARARWDPSLYVPARELFPREFRATAALLPALAAALLLLAHAALLAVTTRRLALRRGILYFYAVAMLCICCVEVWWALWTRARLRAWSDSERARALRHAAELPQYLTPLLTHLAVWHPFPQHLSDIIQQEARRDLPGNARVALGVGAALVSLQVVAALLAALAAWATPRPRARAVSLSAITATTPLSSRKGEGKPRAVYRNGRLILLTQQPEHTQALVINRTVGYP